MDDVVRICFQRRVKSVDRSLEIERMQKRDCSVELRLGQRVARRGEANGAEFLEMRVVLVLTLGNNSKGNQGDT